MSVGAQICTLRESLAYTLVGAVLGIDQKSQLFRLSIHQDIDMLLILNSFSVLDAICVRSVYHQKWDCIPLQGCRIHFPQADGIQSCFCYTIDQPHADCKIWPIEVCLDINTNNIKPLSVKFLKMCIQLRS